MDCSKNRATCYWLPMTNCNIFYFNTRSATRFKLAPRESCHRSLWHIRELILDPRRHLQPRPISRIKIFQLYIFAGDKYETRLNSSARVRWQIVMSPNNALHSEPGIKRNCETEVFINKTYLWIFYL